MALILLCFFLFTVGCCAQSYFDLICDLHVDQNMSMLKTNTTLANNSFDVFNIKTCVSLVQVTVLSLKLSACKNPDFVLTVNSTRTSIALVADVSTQENASKNFSFCLTTETFLKEFSDSLPANLTFTFKAVQNSSSRKCSAECGKTTAFVTVANPLQPQLQVTGVARSKFFEPYLLTENLLTMIPTKPPDSATDAEQCVDVQLKLLSSNNTDNASSLLAADQTTVSLKLSTVTIVVLVRETDWPKMTSVIYHKASFHPGENGLIPGFDDTGKSTTSHKVVNEAKLVSALCFNSVHELYLKAFQWTEFPEDFYEVQVWYTYLAEHSDNETTVKISKKSFTVVWSALWQKTKDVKKTCIGNSVLHQAPVLVFYLMHMLLLPLNIIAWSRYIWYQHYVKKQEEFCAYFLRKVQRGVCRAPTEAELPTLSQRAETLFPKKPKCCLPGTNVDLRDVAVICCSDISERKKLQRMVDEIPEFVEYWKSKVQSIMKRISFSNVKCSSVRNMRKQK